jgi:hypothetical protein
MLSIPRNAQQIQQQQQQQQPEYQAPVQPQYSQAPAQPQFQTPQPQYAAQAEYAQQDWSNGQSAAGSDWRAAMKAKKAQEEQRREQAERVCAPFCFVSLPRRASRPRRRASSACRIGSAVFYWTR